MRRRRLVDLAVVAVAVLGLGLGGAVSGFAATASRTGGGAIKAKAEPLTVGEFTVQLATALQLAVPKGGFSSESASLVLWKNGVKVPANHEKALTEEDVVTTLTQLGYTLRTEDPGRFVTSERANAILNTFVDGNTGEKLRKGGATISGNGGDDFNNGNGKGGKFKSKKDKSPDGGGDD
jgi:hypothetical protein